MALSFFIPFHGLNAAARWSVRASSLKLFFVKFPKRRQQALDFFHRVVVDQADAQHPAESFDTQSFRQIQGVVVAIPGENAPLSKKSRNRRGIVMADAQRKRRAALAKLFRVGDAVDLCSRD